MIISVHTLLDTCLCIFSGSVIVRYYRSTIFYICLHPLSISETPAPTAPAVADPCYPSPCGANADCSDKNGIAVCICRDEYFGNPYSGCKPECVLDSDCPRDKNCDNNKCKNPCPGQCGSGAECHVANHIIMCNCPEGYTGDPFSYCRPVPQTPPPREPQYTNPCVPSPCGQNAQCREANNAAVCSCLPGYHGDATVLCRPECVSNAECAPSLACLNQKCKDPCAGMCGHNAQCRVVNHSPRCNCLPGYEGDPYVACAVVICEYTFSFR